MPTEWMQKLSGLVVVEPVRNMHELADKFRQRARELRAGARRRHFWPWTRDRLLIEAAVWDEAAAVVDNTVVMDNEKL